MSGGQMLLSVPTTGGPDGGRWYRLLPSNRISDEEKAAAAATAAAHERRAGRR